MWVDIVVRCTTVRHTGGASTAHIHHSYPTFTPDGHIHRHRERTHAIYIVSAHMQSVSFRRVLFIHPHVVPMQVYNRETYEEATNLLLGYRGDALAAPLNGQRQILPVACVCVCVCVCVRVCVCVCVRVYVCLFVDVHA